jgi:hypothetical protein
VARHALGGQRIADLELDRLLRMSLRGNERPMIASLEQPESWPGGAPFLSMIGDYRPATLNVASDGGSVTSRAQARIPGQRQV